ncbi:MAG: GTP-binding protein [Desulfobacteraceae bacterium]|nr:GTP-binding protein [Desulfobacteraceae bacterium]
MRRLRMYETSAIANPALTALLPPSALEDPREAAFELTRAALVRSNQIPGVRHRLGWCGINEDVTPRDRPGALTARLNAMQGVYGLLPLDSCPGQKACFSLCYFPAPEEELLESFSIQAGIEALKPDFMDKIREFSRHPDLLPLFHIGFIEAHMTTGGTGPFLALAAKDRLGWVSDTGIIVNGPEGEIEAVAPGESDQDLPALEIAMPFFRSLAASFSYTLSSAPDRFYTQQRTAVLPSLLCHAALEHRLTLGYFTGEAAPEEFDWEEEKKIAWTQGNPLPGAYENEPWWRSDMPGAQNSLDKRAMGITDKPRFILLTGFLGTGKTTFLDNFIQTQTTNNSFVAVIQNEIGEKSLDARLLDETYAVTQMDEGCVCCSLAGNLRTAMSDILDRFQPDFVVLETTGLANPGNILREIDDLNDLMEFGSVTTLMDSLTGELTLERFEVARDQVRLADVILLNKCDLATADAVKRLERRINRLNPVAAIHKTCRGDIHPAVLYGINFRDPAKRPLFADLGNGLKATHRDDRIETRLMELSAPLDRSALLSAIEAGGEKILRVKGIAEFNDEQGPMVFQYAPGTCNISPLQARDTHERFLVIIGQDLDTSFNDAFLLTTKGTGQ